MNNRADNRNILNVIKPEKLVLSGSNHELNLSLPGLDAFINDFSLKDFGRGMLNHDLFCLVEALSTFVNDREGIFNAKVHTSSLHDQKG